MNGEEMRAPALVCPSCRRKLYSPEWDSCPDCGTALRAALASPSTLVAPSTPEPSGQDDEHAEWFRQGYAAGFGPGYAAGRRAAPSTEPALERDAVVNAVHDWFCGESVEHGDRRRPVSGWVCERGADAIRARLAESQP